MNRSRWQQNFPREGEHNVPTGSSPNHPMYDASHRWAFRTSSFMPEFSDLFEEDDDIPSLDEIPSALILAGEIDEQTLMKATLKQQQKQAFRLIKKKSNDSHTDLKHATKGVSQGKTAKKNKNVEMIIKKKTTDPVNVSKLEFAVSDSISTKAAPGASDDQVSCDDSASARKNGTENVALNSLFANVKPRSNQENTNVRPRLEIPENSIQSSKGDLSPLLDTTNGNSFNSSWSNMCGYNEFDIGDDGEIPFAMVLGNMAERLGHSSKNTVKLNKSKEILNKPKEILSKPKEILNKHKEIKNKNKRVFSAPKRELDDESDDQDKTEEQFSNKTTERESIVVIILSSADGNSCENEVPVISEKPTEPTNHKGDTITEPNNDSKEPNKIPALPEHTVASVDNTREISNEVRNSTEIKSTPTLKLSKDILKQAARRHIAFRNIRAKPLQADKVKCTACRRLECTSQNMQKMKEIIQVAEKEGFEVRDVVPDGNCMFAAVIDQLAIRGDFTHDAKSLREMAVHWLIENPRSSDGTHFSSFLEEEWDKYLQRMMGEGQWGDHIVLRAIVQILRRTIKILNPGTSAQRWTTIDPDGSEMHTSSWIIYLGLAGEFHYMSLIPKEAAVATTETETSCLESITSEDWEPCSLEGIEDVCMFEEDYIDPWSDLPLAHFSYLLKKIVPISCLETASYLSTTLCKDNEEVRQVMSTAGTPCLVTLESIGDISEGVFLPQLNQQMIEDSRTLGIIERVVYCVRQDFRVEEKAQISRTENDYCTDTRGCPPGYTRIVIPTDLARATGTFYMPHAVEDLTNAQGACTCERSPASVTTPHIHTKQEIALPCTWPMCASTWKARPRREGWPNHAVRETVVDGGCCLIGVPHKLSKTPEIDWQFSFAVAEKMLMRDGMSSNQKYCFILFKAFCFQSVEEPDVLTSCQLKNVFFYACERVPADFWSASPGACILYMTDELLRCFKDRNLPHYFVPANNMINHLSEEQIRNTVNNLERMRAQPVLYLRQIYETYKVIHGGNVVIDRVIADIRHYKFHRSLRTTTLDVFVPTSIDIAHKYIKARQYGDGFNIINQAYEETLAVNTCDDTLPYKVFLTGALDRLTQNDIVWFSVYADRHFAGQIPLSVVSEISTSETTKKISEVLPDDVTSGYGNSLVPESFIRPLGVFCNEFAKFLYFCSGIGASLPVLYYCRSKYQDKMKQDSDSTVEKQRSDNSTEDFPEDLMAEIYIAIFRVYCKQQQQAFFEELIPEFIKVCEKLNVKHYYQLLSKIGMKVNNADVIQIAAICEQTASDGDLLTASRAARAWSWPAELGTSLNSQVEESLSSLATAQFALLQL